MIDNSPQSDNPSPAPRRSHARLNTVTYQRPRCPKCANITLRKYRSVTDQGDGSALSWVICANEQCKHRFRILFE